MQVRIREARPDDAPAIAAFNAAMALETEHLKLDPDRLAGGVAALLADPAHGFYLLAEIDGRPAGQMMITYEWSDWRNGVFWWIQSVFVEPAWRRQGVFRALYDHVLVRARATAGVCGLRLYVENENARAQATYGGLGMSEAPYKMFEVDFVIRRPT